ncbi:MAG: carbamoyl-phosphate synthase large subunit [Desulfobacteraceae bacterium]
MCNLNELKVLIIGPGPTHIGQTGEGMEGALEACRVLAAAGCRLITVDANPDAVFNAAPWSQNPIIAPMVPETIAGIIASEKPDALLTLFGGRNGLQVASSLSEGDIENDFKVKLWGPAKECLDHIRDRDTLQSSLGAIGLKTPKIYTVNGLDAAIEKARQLGFPVVVRCDDAHILPDGLLIYNMDELNAIATTLAGETESKFSVEASLMEWHQVELEMVRDRTGRSFLLGSVEYLDTAGVHPGDAIGVSPPQTLPESLIADLIKHAGTIAEHLKIVGGATIRFAVRPKDHEALVLAVHPRYTTTSALVARVSGWPVARMATLLAAGLALDELPPEMSFTDRDETQYPCVGVKWPKWDASLMGEAKHRLGPQMQATGHHVSYGKTFIAALQKAACSGGTDGGGLLHAARRLHGEGLETLMSSLSTPSNRRPFEIFAALEKGAPVEEIVRRTHMATGFIEEIKRMVDLARELADYKDTMPPEALLHRAKKEGFSNADLSLLLGRSIDAIDAQLKEIGVVKKWRPLPGKDHHLRFGIYGEELSLPAVKGENKVIIIGNGAYAIGNGAECDFAAFQAASTAKALGYTPILLNSSLSGHLTGHSAPCDCYCDTATIEEISDIIRFEKPSGIITQFAGSTADTLTDRLEAMNCPMIGTPGITFQRQQDRLLLKEQIRKLGIPQPASAGAATNAEAMEAATQMAFPIMVSEGIHNGATVLIRDLQGLENHLSALQAKPDHPLWIEQLLEYAIEAQAEVLCDGTKTQTLAVMEQIELAGVHAGDSAAVLPPYSIAPRHVETITAYCDKIATALGIKGLLNLRFGIYRDTVYALGVSNNVSRNMAFISKSLNVPVVEWATRLMFGEKLADIATPPQGPRLFSVRAPVFPFNAFSSIDPLLGPNMRAIGQVMAVAETFGIAYFKALEATQTPLPTQGTVLITVTDEDKTSILEPARIFSELGFKIMSTKGTHDALAKNGIDSVQVRKLGYGRPNLMDEIKNGKVQMVINTPTGGQGQIDDSVIRKAAIGCRVANITTPASALAAAKGIAAALRKDG